nr:GntR family transcriptional regulator [Pseudonocardia sp. C8]
MPAPPDKATALRDWVRSEIRARISDGRLQPGERVLEREVCEGLMVSRVPVREAIRLLEADGYLRVVPNRGVVVNELTPDEIEQIFDVREALETLAARLAARHSDQGDIENMTLLLVECRQAIDAGDLALVGRLNAEFHFALRSAARNKFIIDREEPLIGRLHWVFQRSPDPERVWRGHRSLLDAVIAGDEEAAAAAAVLDNEHNRQIALTRVRAEPRA